LISFVHQSLFYPLITLWAIFKYFCGDSKPLAKLPNRLNAKHHRCILPQETWNDGNSKRDRHLWSDGHVLSTLFYLLSKF